MDLTWLRRTQFHPEAQHSHHLVPSSPRLCFQLVVNLLQSVCLSLLTPVPLPCQVPLASFRRQTSSPSCPFCSIPTLPSSPSHTGGTLTGCYLLTHCRLLPISHQAGGGASASENDPFLYNDQVSCCSQNSGPFNLAFQRG